MCPFVFAAEVARASAFARPAAQFVPSSAAAPLIAVFTAGLVGFVRPSAVVAFDAKRTTPTRSVDPSAIAALFSATKNCFSQERIGAHPVPEPPPVLPETSMT